jgi:hypothetical protein
LSRSAAIPCPVVTEHSDDIPLKFNLIFPSIESCVFRVVFSLQAL